MESLPILTQKDPVSNAFSIGCASLDFPKLVVGRAGRASTGWPNPKGDLFVYRPYDNWAHFLSLEPTAAFSPRFTA
jgi:hypothetical protein